MPVSPRRPAAPRCLAAALIGLTLGCASGSRGPRATPVPIPRPTRSMRELEAALAAAEPETRAAAAWALAGARKVPDSVFAALARARIEDPEERVRLGAAWAVGHLDLPSSDHSTDHDQQPRLQVQPKPVYPREAYERHVEGTVTVEFLIDEQGRVAHAEVRESMPVLDAAALDCVKAWRFEPLKRDGKPLAVMATAPVTFNWK